MKRRIKWAAVLTGVAAAAVGAVGYCYHTAFLGGEKRQAPIHEVPDNEVFSPYREDMLANIDRLLAEPYERVTVRSHDGLKLVGKLYEGKPGAPLILFFHGYRSTAERDASGGFQMCREKGWHLLMVDQRAHGESEGHTITFGIRERYDCQAWAQYVFRRFGSETPVFLWGISMGAATVLMASDLELPENVRGIVADCGFDTPADIIRETIRRRRLPLELTYRMVRLSGRVFGGFRLDEISALECVSRARLPVFLVHGEADEIVPCEMVHHLETACACPVTVLTVPGAAHGISWYVDMPGYRQALERFMKENLVKNQETGEC